MSQLVQTVEHGDIREIRMARPPVNALNPDLCRDLISALEAARHDGVRGVVVSGGERIFTGGLDVPYLLSLGQDKSALLDAWQAFFGLARTLAELPLPVAAAITGHSPAGGCVLALCCDYRVMACSTDPARPYAIGLNEVQVGLAVPEGIQRLLRRVIGAHRAERLLVSGELVPAEHALQIGLVDALAPAAEVTPLAVQWLQRLLALPHQPMLQTRAVARADVAVALQPELIRLDRFVDNWYLADAQRALHALVDKLKK